MTPTITLHAGDNRDHLRRLIKEGVRVHSVVCDPPYFLESVVKRFGKEGSAPAKHSTDGRFTRLGSGFMNQSWDGADEDGYRISFDPEFWRLIHDILLPGGFVAAFSSARTGHWQAVAMEQAGFIIHPFRAWAFHQGMPKGHSIAMAIDKAAGVKGGRGAPKSSAHAGWIERGAMRGTGDNNEAGWQRPWMADPEKVADAARRYEPATDEAKQWEGWYCGGFDKPVLEPIYIGQRPISEKTFAANVLKHGVGAVNIDGTRVPSDSGEGRWPGQLMHDGSDSVLAMFPDSKGQQGDVKGTEPSCTGDINTVCYGKFDRIASTKRGDTGSSARFYHSFQDDDENPLGFYPKASKKDRIVGCNLCGGRGVGREPDCTCLNEDGKRDLGGHPTVKPVALMRHLCKTFTPPGGTILDPFGGTGTTALAARLEGFNCITMEREADYVKDIEARLGIRAEGSTGIPRDQSLEGLLGIAAPERSLEDLLA